jgi:Beta-propeller repeat
MPILAGAPGAKVQKAGARSAFADEHQASALKHGAALLSFELNRGQFAPGVLFVGRGAGYTLSLTETGAVVVVNSSPKNGQAQAGTSGFPSPNGPSHAAPRSRHASSSTLMFGFTGRVNQHAHVTGQQPLVAKVNYFIGNNPSGWRVGVPTFARVQYSNLYPRVDLIWYVSHGHLEYDWLLRRHAKASGIGLSITGAQSLAVDNAGRLVIRTLAGRLTESPPLASQNIQGVRHEIKAWWSLGNAGRVRLRLGKYNHNASVRIDPAVLYSTYVNAGDNSVSTSVAADGQGSVYLTGFASGVELPGATSNFVGATDAFVTKVSAATGGTLFTTYLGGEGTTDTAGRGIAVDSSGNVYAAGYAGSSDLPNQTNSYYDHANWLGDAFMSRLDPTTGDVVYTTYIGGAEGARGMAVAVEESSDVAYLAGWTPSSDLPAATNSFPGPNGGPSGPGSAFVSKLDTGTGEISWSTYVGGSTPGNSCCNAGDEADAVSVDGSGNVYLGGTTSSSDLPSATNSYDPASCVNPPQYSNTFNSFVAKVGAATGSILYTTYVGGDCRAWGEGLAVDGNSAYLVGATNSLDLPKQTNALVSDKNALPYSAIDGYLSRLDTSTGNVTYSTYLGGRYLTHNDGSWADPRAAFDSCPTDSSEVTAGNGIAYLVGGTSCPDILPSSDPYQGSGEGFMTQVDTTTGDIACTTLITGSADATGVATDVSGSVYVGGSAGPGPPNSTNEATGYQDGFFAGLTPGSSCGRQLPGLTWSAPDPIQYPAALGDAQLDATASVPGTFTYYPPAGTILQTGSGQILLATFAPDDLALYTPETVTTTIDVLRSGKAASR